MTYKDETSKYLDNSKMTITEGASKLPDPKKPGDKKKKKNKQPTPTPTTTPTTTPPPRPFMSGNRDEKKGDMESVAGGLKGAQMLIKTLFPKDEPIPRR